MASALLFILPVYAGEAPVATVNGQTIQADDIDAPIRLALFDLEWQKYQLRRASLLQLIEQTQARHPAVSAPAKIYLLPPMPPRVAIPQDKRPVQGAAEASLRLSVFCSFQSPHCAQLQPLIGHLLNEYAPNLQVAYYESPQGFHRYGKSAANAALCAAAVAPPQDSQTGWKFRDALYADFKTLTPTRFRNIAEQLNINQTRFDACLESEPYSANIEADLALATSLGLSNVPVVFINGLYVKGPQSLDAYRYYLDSELQSLAGTEPLLASTRPLKLVATSVATDSQSSSAVMELTELQEVKQFRIGDHLLPGVVLLAVESQRVIIEDEGKQAFIRLQTSQGGHVPASAAGSNSTTSAQETQFTTQNVPTTSNESRTSAQPDYRTRQLPPGPSMPLSRDWVNEQLAQREHLEALIKPAEHVVEGVHLVRLENVDNERFYSTLGLKSGDVLMRVNDSWVHEGQNQLWERLAEDQPLTVIIMRQGFPVRYDYFIE